MHAFVSGESAFSVELFITNSALKRFVTRMDAFVFGEVAFLVELFITNSALKRFVTRMDAFVSGESAFSIELLITTRTLIRPFLCICSIGNGDGILLWEVLQSRKGS
jgi:hypothetical protein